MLKRESNYAPVGCLNHEPRATSHEAPGAESSYSYIRSRRKNRHARQDSETKQAYGKA